MWALKYTGFDFDYIATCTAFVGSAFRGAFLQVLHRCENGHAATNAHPPGLGLGPRSGIFFQQ